MAVTKIWKVKNELDKAISYIENKEKTENKQFNEEPSLSNLVYYAINPHKTEKQLFVTGVNCNENSAVQEMQDVKNMFGKTGGIKAFHAVQSFAEGEVTPQIAHEIGVKLANEMWGDRFQVVVSTHLNTENLHNHFVINSVSFKDGKRLYDNLEHLATLRSKSDELCLDYQLSVLKERPTEKGIDFEKFLIKYNAKNQYYGEIRQDVDNAIKQANSYMDFLKIMREIGYEVNERANKLSIRRLDRKRNIRIERVFGENYSINRIQERVLLEQAPQEMHRKYYQIVFKPKWEYNLEPRKSKLQKQYITKSIECYLEARKRRISNQKEINKLHRITQNTMFLCSHKIETIKELFLYKENCQTKIISLTQEIKKNEYYLRKTNTSAEKREFLIEKQKELRVERAYLREEIRKCDQVYEMTSMYREEKENERRESIIHEYGNRYRS